MAALDAAEGIARTQWVAARVKIVTEVLLQICVMSGLMLCCRAGSLWHLEGLWCLRVEGHAVQEWLKNRLLDPVEEGSVILSAWGATHLMTASNRMCVGCVGGWKDIIVWQVSGYVEVLIHGTYFCGFSIVTVLNGSYNPDQCRSSYKKSMWYLYKSCLFFFLGSDFLKML